MQYYLSTLTMTQLVRLYYRIWDKMTEGDGYQPFGYDRVTLYATHPYFMRVLDAIKVSAALRAL